MLKQTRHRRLNCALRYDGVREAIQNDVLKLWTMSHLVGTWWYCVRIEFYWVVGRVEKRKNARNL